MLRSLFLSGLSAGCVLCAAGCKHNCRRGCDVQDSAPGGFLAPPITPPAGGGATIPPPSVPTSPGSLPPPVVPETRPSFRFDGAVPPTDYPAPRQTPSFAPKPELLLPDPLPPASGPTSPSPSAFLGEPIRPPAPPSGGDPPPRVALAPAAPDPAPAVTRGPLVGLPGILEVSGKKGVYSGRRPTLDGFDSLKANGFRTLVYLYPPGGDVAPARELAEKRGLRFEAIAVGPSTLASAASVFNAAVTDPAARPVYVADEDGLRAGFLWYLQFRTVDVLNDDAARVRATPLGLPGATGETEKQFWAAAQQFLSTR